MMKKPTKPEREAYIIQYIKEHGMEWWCQTDTARNYVMIMMKDGQDAYITNPSEQFINFLKGCNKCQKKQDT